MNKVAAKPRRREPWRAGEIFEDDAVIRYDDKDGRSCRVHTNDMDFSKRVVQIEKVTRMVIHTRGPLFSYSPHKGQGKATPLGEKFLKVLKYDFSVVRDMFPHHTFTPLLGLFETHTDSVRHLLGVVDLSIASDVIEVNLCIEAIRLEAKSREFMAKREKFARAVRDNTRSLRTLVDGIYAQWSRNLVLRIDVGFRQASCYPWASKDQRITYEQARAYRETLITYLQTDFPRTLRGYAWTMEEGFYKSYHCHLLIFVDGNEHRDHVGIVREIGEVWRDQITQGKGTYWNVNAHADEYIRRGVGDIHYSNVEAMNALMEYVVPYITKGGHFIRMNAGDDHTYDRSQLSKVKPIKQGRRRTSVSMLVGPAKRQVQPS